MYNVLEPLHDRDVARLLVLTGTCGAQRSTRRVREGRQVHGECHVQRHCAEARDFEQLQQLGLVGPEACVHLGAQAIRDCFRSSAGGHARGHSQYAGADALMCMYRMGYDAGSHIN